MVVILRLTFYVILGGTQFWTKPTGFWQLPFFSVNSAMFRSKCPWKSFLVDPSSHGFSVFSHDFLSMCNMCLYFSWWSWCSWIFSGFLPSKSSKTHPHHPPRPLSCSHCRVTLGGGGGRTTRRASSSPASAMGPNGVMWFWIMTIIIITIIIIMIMVHSD